MRRRLQADQISSSSSSPSKIIQNGSSSMKRNNDEDALPIHDFLDCNDSCKRKAWLFGLINGRRLIARIKGHHRRRYYMLLTILILGLILFGVRIFDRTIFDDYMYSFRSYYYMFRIQYYDEGMPFRTDKERYEYVEKNVIKGKRYTPIVQPETDTYDIFNCPPVPTEDYPREYPILDVLENWPIDDTKKDHHDKIHQGHCVFDFAKATTDEEVTKLKRQIHVYQQAEVPFVIRNDPNVIKTVVRWNYENDEAYLRKILGTKTYRGEVSQTNHMMYWNINKGSTKVPKGFKRPTVMTPFTFPEWYDIASSPSHHGAADSHAYIRMDGCWNNKRCDSTYRRTGLSAPYKDVVIDPADFWIQEMPFFDPSSPTSDMYVIKEKGQRGIQCRFGMEGLVAENHFDGDRNFIAILGGERRYLLGHPKNCLNMYLYEQRHPMERHSIVDWSAPNITAYPDFAKVHVSEVVLQAGDVLYLPTQWFHHIISLNINYQCNTRSGYSPHYEHHILKCGFHYRH